jgi:hypothetical protein
MKRDRRGRLFRRGAEETEVKGADDAPEIDRLKKLYNLKYQAAIRELCSIAREAQSFDFTADNSVLRFRELIHLFHLLVTKRFLSLSLSSSPFSYLSSPPRTNFVHFSLFLIFVFSSEWDEDSPHELFKDYAQRIVMSMSRVSRCLESLQFTESLGKVSKEQVSLSSPLLSLSSYSLFPFPPLPLIFSLQIEPIRSTLDAPGYVASNHSEEKLHSHDLGEAEFIYRAIQSREATALWTRSAGSVRSWDTSHFAHDDDSG